MQNKGFTLLEMLVNLFIVSSIIFVFVAPLSMAYNSMIINGTISLIGSEVQKIQSTNMSYSKTGYVHLKNDKIVSNYNDKIHATNLDKKVSYSSNFNDNKIEFNKYGNITRGGHIQISRNGNEKKIIFTLGEGRFRIE